MDARLNYQGSAVAMKFAKYLMSAGKVVSDSALPARSAPRPPQPVGEDLSGRREIDGSGPGVGPDRDDVLSPASMAPPNVDQVPPACTCGER
jgi:hypothetical protein